MFGEQFIGVDPPNSTNLTAAQEWGNGRVWVLLAKNQVRRESSKIKNL